MDNDECVYLPGKLIDELRKRDIEVEDFVLDALSAVFAEDPEIIAETRIEIAERYLNEAKEYISKGDAVQASEKLYKVVEECIKALAQVNGINEYREAVREGRWWTNLLGRAARTLSRVLHEPRVEFVWGVAYDLHVWGFHEAKYGIDYVAGDLDHVQWLLDFARRLIRGS